MWGQRRGEDKGTEAEMSRKRGVLGGSLRKRKEQRWGSGQKPKRDRDPERQRQILGGQRPREEGDRKRQAEEEQLGKRSGDRVLENGKTRRLEVTETRQERGSVEMEDGGG